MGLFCSTGTIFNLDSLDIRNYWISYFLYINVIYATIWISWQQSEIFLYTPPGVLKIILTNTFFFYHFTTLSSSSLFVWHWCWWNMGFVLNTYFTQLIWFSRRPGVSMKPRWTDWRDMRRVASIAQSSVLSSPVRSPSLLKHSPTISTMIRLMMRCGPSL